MSGFEIGQTVRYSRTGTVGKIVSFADIEGNKFAEIDATGLLYRLDQLIVIHDEIKAAPAGRNSRQDAAEEQAKLQEMQETAWQNTDQSCEGGG